MPESLEDNRRTQHAETLSSVSDTSNGCKTSSIMQALFIGVRHISRLLVDDCFRITTKEALDQSTTCWKSCQDCIVGRPNIRERQVCAGPARHAQRA